MPAGTSGTVHVRVIDTDRTAGNRVLDMLHIDEMYFFSGNESQGALAMADEQMWAGSYGDADLSNLALFVRIQAD